MRETAKAREIVDGVAQVHLPLPMRPTIINVYLVRGRDGWTLIDTGMHTDDSLARFREALDEVGIAPQSITRLIATHHHVDHYGTSAPIAAFTHAEVYLHPLEAERATLMGHVPGENTEYLTRHGVPDVPLDQRLPSPARFFGPWYAPAAPTIGAASSSNRSASSSQTAAGRVRPSSVAFTPRETGRAAITIGWNSEKAIREVAGISR